MESALQAFGILYLIISLVVIFFFAWGWGRIARKCNRSFWLYAIGMFIPILNIILFFTLAFSKD